MLHLLACHEACALPLHCGTTAAQANRNMLKLVLGPKGSSPDLAVTLINSSFGKVLLAVPELKLKCLGLPGFETDHLEKKYEIIIFE